MARPIRISNETTKIFSERLSDLVEEKKKTGLTQKEIANDLGIASGTLSDWCADNKTAGIDAIPKLVKYFNVSADWLLGCSDCGSRNETIQNIHNMTGLSAKAISTLKFDKMVENNNYVKFLNSFIESDLLKPLSALIDIYIEINNDAALSIDLADFSNELDEVSIKKDIFIKSILTEYFFKIISEK